MNTSITNSPMASSATDQDLLVSTSTAVLRVAADDYRSQPKVPLILAGEGLYYGLALESDESLWVAARQALVSDSTAVWDERGKLINVGPLTSRSTAAPERPLRDLHGIALHNNAVWCTCSFDDAISIYDLVNRTWIWWHPMMPNEDTGADQFHFNTIMFEGELVWVLAHRRGPSWLVAFPVAEALVGNTVAPVRQIQLGQQAHNMWRQAGELCTCSSGEGALLGERGWRLETGGFPRGVAKITDGWVVGISELKERRARDLSNASLNFYNAHWQHTGQVTIPDAGMVLDIITVPRSMRLPVVGWQPVIVS